MISCVNTLAADQYAAERGRESAYDIYREYRQEEIADALIAGKPVFDGRSSWFKFHCWEHVDCGGALDRILSADGDLERLDAIADVRQQLQTAANVIAAQIVDDVIDHERRCREGHWDED